jgi:hypothetical protein
MKALKLKILLVIIIVILALLAGAIFAARRDEYTEGKIRYADVSPDGLYIAIIQGNKLLVFDIGRGAIHKIAEGMFLTCRWDGLGNLWFDKVETEGKEKSNKVKLSIYRWNPKLGTKIVITNGSQPCPSPDGKRLIYRPEPELFALVFCGGTLINAVDLLKKENLEEMELEFEGGIVIYDLTKGKALPLASDSIATTYAWSPDSQFFACLSSISKEELEKLEKTQENENENIRQERDKTRLLLFQAKDPSLKPLLLDEGDFLYTIPTVSELDAYGPYLTDDGSVVVERGGPVIRKAELYLYSRDKNGYKKQLIWSSNEWGFKFAISTDKKMLLIAYVREKPHSVLSPFSTMFSGPPPPIYEHTLHLVNLQTNQEKEVCKFEGRLPRLFFNKANNSFYVVTDKEILKIDYQGHMQVVYPSKRR